MTRGDAEASLALLSRFGLLEGTVMPMKKIVAIKSVKTPQKVHRIADGTVFEGFAVSPAPTPTSSVPWYENPAVTRTDQNPTNLPLSPGTIYSAKGPGCTHASNPR
ncbi:hypothetical protein RRF57_000049 [Xylaria bambusicola]|uniref:Uncharacterized protein n=1 Tax=Xylaria bambusicola TaxID=326684 RepID=A0AAN7UMX0_9PEZI